MKSGILPRPAYINGLRAWREADITAAEKKLRAKPPRALPGEAIGRDLAHEVRDEFGALKAAAANALAMAGVRATAEVLERHVASGKLAEIPIAERRKAIRELTRLVQEPQP